MKNQQKATAVNPTTTVPLAKLSEQELDMVSSGATAGWGFTYKGGGGCRHCFGDNYDH